MTVPTQTTEMFATYGKENSEDDFAPIGLFRTFYDALASDNGGFGFFQVWKVSVQKLELLEEEKPGRKE